MSDIPAALRDEVVLRAGNRCEYCGLSQAGQEAAFHVDHVVPRVAGGPTELNNLALACVSCSLRKWSTSLAPDPAGRCSPHVRPRRSVLEEIFQVGGVPVVVPLTPTGRATVAANNESSVGDRHPT